MADLASLEDLMNRLDWELDEDEQRIATAALEDASDQARYYARRDWADASQAPRMARTLVLKACKRLMQNPEGLVQSRAGDETLGYSDKIDPDDAGTVYFSAAEIRLLQGLGGAVAGGLVSSSMTAWGTNIHRYRYRHGRGYAREFDPYAEAGYVPVDGSDEKPFPLFADPDGSV